MIKIKVPPLPGDVASGKIEKLYVDIGHTVRQGDRLIDIDTSLVVLEVVAQDDGVVEQLYVCPDDDVATEQALLKIRELSVHDKAALERQSSSEPAELMEKRGAASASRVMLLIFLAGLFGLSYFVLSYFGVA